MKISEKSKQKAPKFELPLSIREQRDNQDQKKGNQSDTDSGRTKMSDKRPPPSK